jgi:two-component system, LytTR family, response regulator
MSQQFNCLIIDDEKPAHQVLAHHISQFPELILTGNAYNGEQALHQITSGDYDIVFLDIQMPLANGIDLLRSLNNKPAIIITTAFENYAFEAYQNDAVDYLLKPVSLDRFKKAIEKAKLYCASIAKPKEPLPILLSFKSKGADLDLFEDEICYVQSAGNYLKIYLNQGSKHHMVYGNLKAIGGTKFMQVHKSYVVNISSIKEVKKSTLLLKTGAEIPVGRKYEILIAALKP